LLVKHIAIDARYINRPGMGIYTYLIGLIDALRAQDYKITLLVDKDLDDDSLLKQENLVILRASNRIIWEQILLPRFLKKTQPDIFIAPANFGIPLFYRKHSTKFVLIIHDFIPLRFPLTYLLKRPIYMSEFLLSVPISIYRSDLILANSKFTANESMKLFHKKASNVYIPKQYKILKSVASTKHSTYPGKYFLYNSGADPRKKLGTLLQGFNTFNEAHPDYSLLIMGNGYDKYKSLVEARQYTNIIFLGFVSEQEKIMYLQNAQAMITVSKMEGFGLPVLEAFCTGLPVICSKNSALQEVANDAALYIKSLTSASVAAALNTFATLALKEKRQLISNGYRRVKFFNDFNSGLVISHKIRDLLEV